MIGLGIIAALCWAVAMAIGRSGRNAELVDALMLIGVASGLGIFPVAVLRALLMRCPDCKHLSTRQIRVDKATETRKFHCARCGVVWDSSVRFDFGGD